MSSSTIESVKDESDDGEEEQTYSSFVEVGNGPIALMLEYINRENTELSNWKTL